MITSWPLNVASASSMPPCEIDRLLLRSPWEITGKVTSSDSHGFKLPNWWVESDQHPACLQSTASMFSSNLALSWPPSASPNSITASECICKFTRSWPPDVCPNSLTLSLRVGMVMAYNCISKLARSQPPSASPRSLNCYVQAHLDLLPSTTCSLSRYTVCRWVAM